jgi:pimeloyl-ACP methyl ester carboxylesterase
VSRAPYDALDVPVAGGLLRVGRWSAGPDAPVVLAAHGVTGNHLSWAVVADGLGATVLAPDLRGRGRSQAVGPTGMTSHSADLLAVLDLLDVERALLAGHSMGGFVASRFAALHPDRVSGVVLVDGGLPLPEPPPGTTAEQAIAATIGPAADRLSMTFASVGDYLDYWRPHPALGPAWSPAVEDYLAYDLVGDPPALRSSVVLDAVRVDSGDLLDAEGAAADVRARPEPTVFLHAERGLLDQPDGLYPHALMVEHTKAFPDLDVRHVADVNHYTILLAEPGAAVVRDTIRELAAGC